MGALALSLELNTRRSTTPDSTPHHAYGTCAGLTSAAEPFRYHEKSSHTNSKQFVPDSVGVFLTDLSLPHPTLPTQPVPYMISTVLAKDTLSKNQSAGPMTGGSATAGVPIKAQADSMKSCAKT